MTRHVTGDVTCHITFSFSLEQVTYQIMRHVTDQYVMCMSTDPMFQT